MIQIYAVQVLKIKKNDSAINRRIFELSLALKFAYNSNTD